MAGRPTKYEGEKTIAELEAIIEKMKVEKFLGFCGVEHIAQALGVCRDTIYEWKDKHPEFSYTIKRWETKRNALFYSFMISKQMTPAVWIFLAKNWLGMRDKQEFEVGDELKKILVEKVLTDKRPKE